MKVQKIAFLILFGSCLAASLLLFPISWPAAFIGTVGSLFLTIREIVALIGVIRQAPSCQNIFAANLLEPLPSLGNLTEAAGIATKDSRDSNAWKLELIRSARRSIVLSGNYCGGHAYDEVLDLIAERMRVLPELRTSLLSSDIFITKENTQKIEAMKDEFKDRFACTITLEVAPFVSPMTGSLSMTSNHVKGLVIDYGAYFMMGGSGIVTPWSLQEGISDPVESGEGYGCFYDTLQMKAFRDMDFVFRSNPNGLGTRVYVELTKLIARYGTAPIDPVDQLPASEPLFIAKFEEAAPLHLTAALYATGPEHEKNSFFEEMIRSIHAAEETIVIDHMYFHPPKELMEALIQAGKRGVKITLLTNKHGDQSPGSHFLYAELSRYWAKKLHEENPIDIYEYEIPYTTLHKKIILIDGKTALLGSANIGYKSLEGPDYEIDLKIESEDFAAKILESIQQDIVHCTKVSEEEAQSISLKTHLFSSVQSLFAPFL